MVIQTFDITGFGAGSQGECRKTAKKRKNEALDCCQKYCKEIHSLKFIIQQRIWAKGNPRMERSQKERATTVQVYQNMVTLWQPESSVYGTLARRAG
jgi:hypothetical protein